MAAAKPIDFRALQSELQAILDDLQGNTLDVDEALKKYERGMAITKELEAYLTIAEHKISKVKS